MTLVLGCDPGATTGVCLLNVGPHQGHLIARCVWEGLDDEGLAQRLRAAVACYDMPLVAIERVEAVHGSSRMGSSYAEGLARSNWVGGLLAGVARAAGRRVVTPTAGEWRRALCGASSATDARVKAMIRLRLPDWPKVSNEHERDAAGVALFVGLTAQRSAA